MNAWDLICFGLVCAGIGAVVGALTDRNKTIRTIEKGQEKMQDDINEIVAQLKAATEKIDGQAVIIADTRGVLAKVAGETEGLKSEVQRLNELLGQGQPDLTELKAVAASLGEKLGAQSEALATVKADAVAVDEKVPDATTPAGE